MQNVSTSNPKFAEKVANVLRLNGEIVAVFRFDRSAGGRSYEFFNSCEGFFQRIADLPPKTSVIIFEKAQFPIRGVTDNSLIEQAKSEIPEGTDWAIVRTTLLTMGSQSWFHVFEDSSHLELENELRDEYCWGHPVAVGVEPDWHDLESTFSALIPHEDGRIEQGIY